ncbi:hypothetical protein C7B67_16375 [filamentous cyanobacterium Phorm 6]|nr:hypothetical protein C7B67_16375 [filamentous cyanobacterium Phorm 6]
MNSELRGVQALPVKWTESTKVLLKFMEQVVNLDEVIERLQATDCQSCSLFTQEQVKFAFLKWIEQHIESIESDPEWFINRDFKHFYRNLPFDDLQQAIELREYDSELMHECDNPDDFSDMSEDMKEQLARGLRTQELEEYFTNKAQIAWLAFQHSKASSSSLEDDFEGTPEEAAINAIDW